MDKTSLDIREALIPDCQKRSSGPFYSHNHFHIQHPSLGTMPFYITVKGQSSIIPFRSSWQNSCTNLDANTDF